MNIDDLKLQQQKLNESVSNLAKQLEEINEKIKAEEDKKPWMPCIGERYYAVNSNGTIISITYRNDSTDRNYISAGNYYRTSEEAEKVAEQETVIRLLRKQAEVLNGNWVADYNNDNQLKYRASVFRCDVRAIIIREDNPFIPVFKSKQVLFQACGNIGRDRIIKAFS